MYKILVIRLYFPLDALHFSDYTSPPSGATLQAVHRIYWYMSIRLAVVWLQPHNSQMYGTGVYWYMRCTACKIAPEDGLIQSETCRASNGK